MSLREIYSGIQNTMLAKLKQNNIITHPGAKGTATENDWLSWLKDYLPNRYKADKAQVIDSRGELSDEIDIVIYDAQYSPMILNANTTKYVTAESVYAIFEVKQNLNKEHIEYAYNKLKSVTKLHRTSAQVKYSTGIKDGKTPERIIGGLLTTSCDWKKNVKDNIEKNNLGGKLELICCIEKGTYLYDDDAIKMFSEDEALIAFYFELLKKLQSLGTVTAIEFDEYMDCIGNEEVEY